MPSALNESHDRLPRGEKPSGRVLRLRRLWRVSRAAFAAFCCCALVSSASTPSLLWVQAPLEGAVIGIGGVEVMIRFPRDRGVEANTFVALLNGADVTSEFTTGSNGAIGRLFGVLDGENTLHFEVQGDRGGAPDRLLRDSRDVRFLVRLPQGVDRA